MINTRRLVSAIAIPVLIGTIGFVALNQATAQSPNQLAQDSSQPNRQREGRKNHRGPDFAAAAQKLGVSEADLKAALGVPSDPQGAPGEPGQRPPRPDLKAAAEKLGVTEQQLIDALGIPPRPPEEGNQPGEFPPPQQ